MRFYLLLLVTLSFNILAVESASSYFQQTDVNSASLSPSGNCVALITGDKKQQSIELYNVLLKQRRNFYQLSALNRKDASLRKLFWLGDRYLAAEIGFKREGIKHLLNTKVKVEYFIFDVSSEASKPKIYKINARGLIVDPLINDSDHFLFSKRGVNSKVYKVNIKKLNVAGKRLSKLQRPDGGQLNRKNEIASIKGVALKWFTNEGSYVDSVLYFDPLGKLRLAKVKSLKTQTDEEQDEDSYINTWSEIKKKEKKKKSKNLSASSKKKSKGKRKLETKPVVLSELSKQEIAQLSKKNIEKFLTDREKPFLFPVTMLKGSERFYAFDTSDGELRRIYLVDYKNKTIDLAYSTLAYNISSFEVDQDSGRLTSVNLVKDGKLQTDYLDEKGQSYLQGTGNQLNVRLSESLDKKIKLSYLEDINTVGTFFVEHANEKLEVGKTFPNLAQIAPVTMVKNTLKREGIDVEYLLTIPNSNSKPAPLIVYPHGGPIGEFDHPFFDLHTRFLNEQGYAVLRVNFRGSGGYSEALLEAGKGEFGDGILADIHAATIDVSKREDIDSNNMCVAGISFGGYAATMLAIKHPDSYKCAVTVAGISDFYLTTTSTRLSQGQYKWVKEYIGDVSKDLAKIKRISPAYGADKLQVPILIMHGHKDKIVDVEHAYRLRHALERSGKYYEWRVFEEAGHHFSNEGELSLMFDTMVRFIDKNMVN